VLCPQRYEAQGMDDYLFRLDNDWVVDATIKVRKQRAQGLTLGTPMIAWSGT
jgi:hypothetical protein